MSIRELRLKPWQRLGITKKQYLSARPWKGTGLSRERYEEIIAIVPQDALNELKIEAEADALVEKRFGEKV